MADYMGGTDAEKRAWMLNFVQKLQNSMSTYMVVSADVAAISASVNQFVADLAVVETPDGRNPATTSAKNQSRAAAQAICRQYARLIKFNVGIDDQAKIAAGIKPPNVIPEPRPCPVSPPVLKVVAATNGAQTLGYSDSLEDDVRRKPEGADGIVLFRAIDDAPVPASETDKFLFYRKYTTKPMPVFFDPADNGKIATYYARWIGQRGDMSNPSAVVSMAIAA